MSPLSPSSTPYLIRLARADDLANLPAVEIRAGALFAEAGLPEVADNEPADVEFLAAFMRAGALHVAVDANDRPVGFGLTGLLDGISHLYELAVDPAHGRRGLGARLVRAGCAYAMANGCRAMTLSTFRDLPWNGPFYMKLGFRNLMPDEWTPGHHVLHAREVDLGLPMKRRTFMRLDF